MRGEGIWWLRGGVSRGFVPFFGAIGNDSQKIRFYKSVVFAPRIDISLFPALFRSALGKKKKKKYLLFCESSPPPAPVRLDFDVLAFWQDPPGLGLFQSTGLGHVDAQALGRNLADGAGEPVASP